MGYAKEQSPNNKTYTKFYKNKTNNWHTYENNIFSEQMLQGKHQFFYPENEIDAIEYIKNIAYNMNMKIIEDSHNNIGFYSIKKDEIHMPTKDRFNDEREYYSELLRPRLITLIREARQERTLRLLENRFINYDLVICDEFGYVSCDKNAGELLFNHLSLRAGKKSLIITTNLAFNRWGEIIADKVLVAAMVDRLTHKAMLINMTGESFRMKETKKLLKN